MNHPSARLVVHDREIHLDAHDPLAVGDTFDVIRGNGPREGDHMGTATVIGLYGDTPTLDVRFDDAPDDDLGMWITGFVVP